MAGIDKQSKSVAELKAFLRERGVNTSIHRKESLIRLAEAATEIQLEPEEVENYHSDRQNRRTIKTPDGKKVIIPDIFSISDWNNNLITLPTVEMGDIFVYLMTTCMWSNDRLKSYKNDNGYQLYMQRHVDNVVMRTLNTDHLYIKCSCTPETKQKEKPYTTWILMDNKASIKSGGCTCVADDSSCKHCVAVLFALHEFTDHIKTEGLKSALTHLASGTDQGRV
ncbi:unnamed protein product [Mytilus coruscus]|uniref:SWIM-type domain-containing protein n=1 Tax=Mytilus coruscus TaxID=42192 RepID=A0A6J8E6X0_MYTCO|nr:unnamed protein product [Mytilus coruscus]